mmetsp:Transcript_12991/g.17113  ORF Transcript_12991/g.17113 Transcript_12991/m.17113 type:complete len:156 (+) Transcript_12991:85-552(+)
MFTKVIKERRESRKQKQVELAKAKANAAKSLELAMKALESSTVPYLEILSSNQRFISANLNNVAQDLVALRVQVNHWSLNFSKISKDIELLGSIQDWTKRTELELCSLRNEASHMMHQQSLTPLTTQQKSNAFQHHQHVIQSPRENIESFQNSSL